MSQSVTWDYNHEEVGPIVPVRSIRCAYGISLKRTLYSTVFCVFVLQEWAR
ncbi:hypothetical protein PHMEG_00031627 [Phytophthora megakarya]|uniref:Uncharacterized protein n=1 Tax=Phytophthora megakarya TaxID=4795 RepID=A0A225UXR6_9STRA|nr:hypothetical protein PHMEG_00031627 [Phytophthora megakarya]